MKELERPDARENGIANNFSTWRQVLHELIAWHFGLNVRQLLGTVRSREFRMAIGSSIEWTDATWNPVAGCTPVSAGCKNCYAARMALRLSYMPNGTGRKYRNTAARTRGGLPVFTGHINLDPESLDLPRSWRLPRVIFVNSMSDLFHEDVP